MMRFKVFPVCIWALEHCFILCGLQFPNIEIKYYIYLMKRERVITVNMYNLTSLSVAT